MICDKIDAYLRGERVAADSRMLDTATEFFRTSLTRNLTNHKHEERTGLHASSDWRCAKRILAKQRGAPRVAQNPRSSIAFLLGDTIEQMGILLSRLAGVDVVTPGLDGKQERGTIEVEGENIAYALDMTVRDPAGAVVPVDWKSMASYGFDEFEEAIRNPQGKWWNEERFGYLTQLRLYMKAKNAAYGLFVGVAKETGHMAEMHVPQDPSWWEEFTARVRYYSSWKVKEEYPPRPALATSSVKPGSNLRPDGTKGAVEEIDWWYCRYCPVIEFCWPGFKMVPLTSGPKWRKAV